MVHTSLFLLPEEAEMTEEIIELTEEVKPEAPPEAPPEIAPEVIERARLMGHIPKEEFKGDPERWVPADKYVERAESLMPILKSQLGKYEEKITTLESTVESQKKTTEKLLKMSEKIGEEAYKQAKKDLTKKQAQAVADGDVDTWQKIEDEKDKLEKPEPIQVEETPSSTDTPLFKEWHKENNWYRKIGTTSGDEDMTMYADTFSYNLKARNPSLTEREIFKIASEKVKEVFPHKFSNPKREEVSPVDTSIPSTQTKPDGKTYNDLPADAKAQCKILVNDPSIFSIKTNEDFVKSYFEEE